MGNWWTSFWTGLGEACGLIKQKDAEENTPEQQANAQAALIAADQARAAKDIANPNPADLEKDVSK